MISLLLLIAVGAMYYLCYLFGLTASGLYLSDYEEEKSVSELPERKREYFNYLLRNAKRVSVTSSIVQSGSLIVSTICWFLLGNGVNLSNISRATIDIVLIALGWIIYLSVVAVLAPNLKQERVLGVVQAKLWLLKLVMTVCSPVVSFMISQKDRMIDIADLEEKKEEIVERAIESLADSAGIDEPLVEKDVRTMIGNIFDLADSDVRAIMVPRIEICGIGVGATLQMLQEIAAKTGHSRYPVYKDDIDNIKGVLYIKDIFARYPLPGPNDDVTKFARPAYFVPESKKLDVLLDEFKVQKVHIAIVADEYGGTAGMVTLENVLELIVGDIHGEHNVEEADVVKLSDSEYIVSANLSMQDLSEKLELNLEERDFETVGGYIYDLVGSLPRAGQKVAAGGIDYIVEKVTGQRIDKVKIILKPAENV